MSEKDGRLFMEPEIVELVRATWRLADALGEGLQARFEALEVALEKLGFDVEEYGWHPKKRDKLSLLFVVREKCNTPSRRRWWGIYVGSTARSVEVVFDHVRYEDEAPLPGEQGG